MTTVFASRWRALWWSAVVLLTAYCSVPAPEDDAAVATHPAARGPWSKPAPGFADDKNLRDLEVLQRKLPPAATVR